MSRTRYMLLNNGVGRRAVLPLLEKSPKASSQRSRIAKVLLLPPTDKKQTMLKRWSRTSRLIRRKLCKSIHYRDKEISTSCIVVTLLVILLVTFALVKFVLLNSDGSADIGDGFRFVGCFNNASMTDLSFDDVDVEIELNMHDTNEMAKIPPKIVHYLWPAKKTFTFRNYLSLISVTRFVQPDKIIFHLSTDGWWPFCGGSASLEPKPDENRYNHWWEEVRFKIPNLVVKQDVYFYGDGKAREESITSILSLDGGIYVSENVVFTKRVSLNRLRVDPVGTKSPFIGYTFTPTENADEDITLALVYGHSSQPLREIKAEGYCPTAKYDIINQVGQISCLYLDAEVYPHEFWTRDGKVSDLVRFFAYGIDKKLQPSPVASQIPLLCHYIFIGKGDIEFTMFLSVLSCLHVLRAQVFIHGDNVPSGQKWDRLLDIGKRSIKFMYRPLPETVYGKAVTNPSHISDVWRIDILLKYGGIYTDWDVIWLQPVDDLLHFEAVASVDVMDWSPYPDVLNLGVLLAQKDAGYLHQLKKSMKFYQENGMFPLSYFYSACLIPYKVYECYPDRLKIERRLQVICNRGRCHPAWKEGYKNNDLDYKIDWQHGEAYSIHWTYPTPDELKSFEALRAAGNATFMSQVANHILTLAAAH